MVTQYIGARYVPLFADPIEWSSANAYEPLTIVYHQGNSYTSRQAVPAGIDITNTTYWALTGNYNAQIEQYRAEVQTYDGRITANTASNTVQDAQLAGTTSSGIKTLIETNATDIDTLEASDTTHTSQLAGTASSGLKTLIDANTSSNTAQDAQLAGTSSSGLKTLIDGISEDVAPLMQLKNAPLFFVPTYEGDYMLNEQFGCVAHHGGAFYCFNANNNDNTGTLKVFSESLNALSMQKTIQVGHANSCAYDGVRDCFWIAPHMEYVSGQSSYTNDLYQYNTAFTSRTVVDTGAVNTVFAVSFDAMRDVLCAYERAGNVLACHEMAADENAFTEAWRIDLTSYTDGQWQDVFCWDGISYLALPEGTVYVVDSEGSIIGSGEIDNFDDNNYWHFGEHEGWECDEDGALFMARNGSVGLTVSGDVYPINNAFVTSLSFGTKTRRGINTRNAPYPTATLSSADQATFKLANGHLRSLNQLNHLLHVFSTIEVPANDAFVEEYGLVRIPPLPGVELSIQGSYTCTSMNIAGGMFTILVGTNGTLVAQATDYFISLTEQRAPHIRIRMRGSLSFSGTQLIHPTYSPVLCYIKTASDAIVYHSTTVPANSNAVFFGTALIYKDWS